MDRDLTFRILFLMIYGIFATIRLRYRISAARSPGRPGTIGHAGLAVAALVLCLLAGVVLYVLFPAWVDWSQLGLPDWIRWLGVGMALVSVALVAWIHHTLGRFYSARLEIRDGHQLIMAGPYRMVRHPMYSVLWAFGVSIGLVSANALIIVFSVLIILPLRAVAIEEEKMMLGRFGDDYAEYMKHTGRLLPRLRRSKDEPGHGQRDEARPDRDRS